MPAPDMPPQHERRRGSSKDRSGRDARKRRTLSADVNLPQLTAALDPEKMKPAFEEFFRREYPGRGLIVDQVYAGKIYYRPGKNCEIPYGVQCRDRDNVAHDVFLHGKLLPRHENGTDHHENAPATWPGCGFWKPVSFWPEMSMILTTFPYDRGMPYLGQLLEPEYIKKQVQANLPAFDLPPGSTCVAVACRKVKYFPRKRCVVRYELSINEAGNNLRPLIFYGKTYDNQTSLYVYEVLQNIYASPACAGGRLSIPKPILHLDGANTVWLQEWRGIGFSQVARELGWDNLPRSGYLPKIAAMLAALHQIEMPEMQLGAGPSPATVINNAYGDANDITQFLPEKQPELEFFMQTLEAAAPGPPADRPRALIHGSFKMAQILCRQSDLGLVDFDSLAHGDPLYDVAEFAASLAYLTISDDLDAAAAGESIEIFLNHYQQHVPWVCERRRVAWYLTAFLLGKMHSSLKRSEPTAVANMAKAFALAEKWLAAARA